MDFRHMTAREIEEWLQTAEKPDILSAWPVLNKDPRKTVQSLLAKYLSALQNLRQEQERLKRLFQFEEGCKKQGFRYIAGLDEAGRGPLAGPVVAAAVILADESAMIGLDDSKKLSPAERENLYDVIIHHAVAVGVGMASPLEIDRINIYQATRLAMTRALSALSVQPDFLLLDAITLPEVPLPQLSIVGGDGKSLSIAAASVIAKVTRDRYMVELDEKYPEYGFAKHKGYPTKEHGQALRHFGPSPIHRQSFKLFDNQEKHHA